MMKLRVPGIVISIPRIVACLALAGVIGNLQPRTQQSDASQIKPQQTATHEALLSTPAPVTSLPSSTPNTVPVDQTATMSPPSLIAAASIPHSAVAAPVVTPASNVSVADLAPVGPSSGSNTSSTTSGTTPTSTPPAPLTNSYTSTNWAGYMAGAGIYTAISGSWNVPSATSSTKSNAADAAWIGIGGVKNSDLIQVGTEDTVTTHGEVSTAFYELLPSNARTITQLTITPGDSMSASISETSTGLWKITITDNTTGRTYTTAKSYYSSESTAEWIEEDPTSTASGQSVPLDTFTPVTFTNGTVTAVGTNNVSNILTIAASNAQPITLVSSSAQTATPIVTSSVLSADGQSFTATEVSTY